MKVQQFLAHHGILENPFGQEDAQSDHVFRSHCLEATRHPAWDKIFGNPDSPSTAVVFGEKGSGKTAIRLQIAAELEHYNRMHPEQAAFVIEYDDFNPFLDAFRERLHGRKRRPERALARWRLWDHMDAILTLGVRRLVKEILEPEPGSRPGDEGGSAATGDGAGGRSPGTVVPEGLNRLSRLQKRDLLLLAAFYDHTLDQPPKERWTALRRRLRYPAWRSYWDLAVGIVVTLATIVLVWTLRGFGELFQWWVALIILIGWLPWLVREGRLMWMAWRISRQIRAFDHLPNTLRRILARFGRPELAGQPVPSRDRSDDRYELLMKFQSILKTLGFTSVIVLVDRVDEPHLVNGAPERMRDLLWPMFDNKFLKHPGMGFKLLLPEEVLYYLNREEKEFYERSRLDKQNLIPSLEWTGESLYDVANDRLRACARSPDAAPAVRELFDESIDEHELIAIFSRFRVPRHLFKFLYRLLVEHCNRHTEARPSWTISRETLQATLAVYLRDMEAAERGLGTG